MKRKNEEEKLAKEKAEIEKKKREIEELQKKLQEKENMLQEKEEDLQRHKIFSTFLESVVQDKSGDKEGFSEIEDLQKRFKSLKNENKQLMSRVSASKTNFFTANRNNRSTSKWKKHEPERSRSSMSSRILSMSSSERCRRSRVSWRTSPVRMRLWSKILKMR